MSKSARRFITIAILAAWAFDFLFYKQSPGINFALYVAVLLGAGFALAVSERESPARSSLWLLLPIGIFALMTLLRLEPMTVFLSVVVGLSWLMVLAHTFLGGKWTGYRLSDYSVIPFKLGWSALARPLTLFQQMKFSNRGGVGSQQRNPIRTALNILLGLLLALPLLIVLAALLSSADPVFSTALRNIIELFRLEKLFEYVFRGIYITILAYVLIGIYLYVFQRSRDENLLGMEKPLISPFLGSIEAGVIMGCVNLLFLAFVIFQFQYFFGGERNIYYAGFTYAEYARRGFTELVVVGSISLLLLLTLSTFTKRQTPAARIVFSALSAVLGLLMAVILVSAFQRLLLYENAFGFTRLRTYTHVFLVWLGIVLLALIALEFTGRERGFGLALAATTTSFCLTLGILNVDGFIVDQNVKRALEGADLDSDYLLTLSVDSTPVLAEYYAIPSLGNELHDELGLVLVCQAAELDDQSESQTWTGFHISRLRARRLLENLKGELETFQVSREDGSRYVLINGENRSCSGNWQFD
jgi:hypothetical protein